VTAIGLKLLDAGKEEVTSIALENGAPNDGADTAGVTAEVSPAGIGVPEWSIDTDQVSLTTEGAVATFTAKPEAAVGSYQANISCLGVTKALEVQVSAHVHSWDEGTVTTPATCTQAGIRTKTCGRCGSVTDSAIQAKGHSYSDYKCSACDDVQASVTLDKASAYAGAGESIQLHAYLSGQKDNGTETSNEQADDNVTWSVDGTSAGKGVTVTNGLVSIPGNMQAGDTITVTAGKHGKTASAEITVISLELQDAEGHAVSSISLDPYDTVNAKNTADITAVLQPGTLNGTVTWSTEAENITVSQDGQKATITAATAAAIGEHTVTAAYSDTTGSYTRELTVKVIAHEHDYGDGEVTTPATCTQAGIRTYTCSKCLGQKEASIDATGHAYSDYKCGTCGYVDVSLALDKSTVYAKAGSTVQLHAYLSGQKDNETAASNEQADGDVTWGIDETAAANGAGITSGSVSIPEDAQPGDTVVATAAKHGVSASATIVVVGISLSVKDGSESTDTSVTLDDRSEETADRSATLTATLDPASLPGSVTWEIADNDSVSLQSDGNTAGLSLTETAAAGTYTVTASYGECRKTFDVIVKTDPLKGVSLDTAAKDRSWDEIHAILQAGRAADYGLTTAGTLLPGGWYVVGSSTSNGVDSLRIWRKTNVGNMNWDNANSTANSYYNTFNSDNNTTMAYSSSLLSSSDVSSGWLSSNRTTGVAYWLSTYGSGYSGYYCVGSGGGISSYYYYGDSLGCYPAVWIN
jgi:hypothetical protein